MSPKNAVINASVRPAAARIANARPVAASAGADVAAPVPAARSKTIGQAAREAGVHVETIRYYERRGLIPRPAARSGYRVYPEATVERIRSIQRAQDFGFTLREINELFGLSGGTCREMCAKVDAKVKEIEARIASLVELRDELRGLVSLSANAGPATNCLVFKAFGSPRSQFP